MVDLVKQLFDSDRFLPCETSGPNRGFYGGDACASGHVPVGEPALELIERAMTVRIGSGLRENCLDKHVERIESTLAVGDSIHGSEILNRVAESFVDFYGLRGLHQVLSSILCFADATEKGRIPVTKEFLG